MLHCWTTLKGISDVSTFSCISIYAPLPLSLPLSTTKKSPARFIPPSVIFLCVGKVPPQPSPVWQVPTLNLSLYNRYSISPNHDSLWWTRFTKCVSLVQGSPALKAALQMPPHWIWEERITSPGVCQQHWETAGLCCRLAQDELGTMIPSAFSKLPLSRSASMHHSDCRSFFHSTPSTSPCSTTGLAGGPAELMAWDWLSSRERKQDFGSQEQV